GDGVAGVGETVHEHAVRGAEDVEDVVGEGDAAEGDVAGGDAFGEGGEVGLETVGLHAEHLAGAAETADDLVGDEEDVVFFEDLGDGGPVAGRGRDDTAGALDGFADHGGDGFGAFAGDGLFEVVDEFGDEGVVGEAVAVAVGVGGEGVDVAGGGGTEAFVV